MERVFTTGKCAGGRGKDFFSHWDCSKGVVFVALAGSVYAYLGSTLSPREPLPSPCALRMLAVCFTRAGGVLCVCWTWPAVCWRCVWRPVAVCSPCAGGVLCVCGGALAVCSACDGTGIFYGDCCPVCAYGQDVGVGSGGEASACSVDTRLLCPMSVLVPTRILLTSGPAKRSISQSQLHTGRRRVRRAGERDG